MIDNRRAFVVVPAYNESDNLPFLLTNLARMERCLDLRFSVVIVDDGSTDETADVLKSYDGPMDLTVVSHETNLGPGAAFSSGFTHVLAIASDDDLVVTIEADNTGDMCVIGRMAEQLNRGRDVVLASVYGKGHIAGAPLSRRFLSFFANNLMRAVFRIPQVNTFTSFFRVYRCSALRRLFLVYDSKAIEERGFTCMLEVLVKLHMLGCSIGQVPILLDSAMRIGASKMKVVRNSKATLSLMARHLGGAFRPPVPGPARAGTAKT